MVDAITYVALGHVFTANMTGNTVLLAIAATEGDGARALRSLCAVAGFCVGVAAASAALGTGPGTPWPSRTPAVLAAESAALAALAAIAALAGTAVGLQPVLIAVSGVAMGIQSATVWLARSSGTSTTYITGTLTGMIVRLLGRDSRKGEARGVRVPALVWVTYLLAAAAGAAIARSSPASGMWAAAAVALAVALAVARRRLIPPRAARCSGRDDASAVCGRSSPSAPG